MFEAIDQGVYMPKVRSKVTVSTPALPWWLGEGEEECPHCGQFYAVEVEVRCVDCDGPMCPHCKVRHTEVHYVCPACVSSADRTEERSHG